jgi:SAM-dependent methyltransferase
MKNTFSALNIAHRFIKDNVKQGDICIDATSGRGNDTAFLCQLVGDKGKVIAFDIQQEAVDSTENLLKSRNFNNYEIYLESHVNMDRYAESGTVSCITFNLGWLPYGDHRISTHSETSIEAIKKSLDLLKNGGIVSICIYYGKDTGFDEKNAVLEYLKTIDSHEYTVIVNEFVNRPNCPPIPAFIIKGL